MSSETNNNRHNWLNDNLSPFADAIEALEITLQYGEPSDRQIVEKEIKRLRNCVSSKNTLWLRHERIVIDCNNQSFYFPALENRRFLYNPYENILILGGTFESGGWFRDDFDDSDVQQKLPESAKIYINYITGWVSGFTKKKDFLKGVIHFMPPLQGVYGGAAIEKGRQTLRMFVANGAVIEETKAMDVLVSDKDTFHVIAEYLQTE